jgi:hypothetical protein
MSASSKMLAGARVVGLIEAWVQMNEDARARDGEVYNPANWIGIPRLTMLQLAQAKRAIEEWDKENPHGA